MDTSLILATLLLVLVLYGVHRLLQVGSRPKDYPPGPPTLPIIGNIHQIPARDPHLQFEQWAREYGDIYSVMLGTSTMIVLSSDTAVRELMDKRSGNYSGRPDMYIGQKICSDDLRMLMMGNGPTWRGIRKMFHQLLNSTVVSDYVPYQMLENKQLLNDLLDTPGDFLKHFRRYSNALTTSMVFGWRTSTWNDANMQQLFDGFDEFTKINQTGVAALLDAYPVLRKLPDFLSPVQKKAKELHNAERELFLRHWLRAKREAGEGTIKPCFCLYPSTTGSVARLTICLGVGMAETQKKEGFSDVQAAYNAGTLLEAGSDTTSSTLYAIVQAMLLYPEAQRTAQQQIDSVVGESRLPTMEDQAQLPYIRMIVKETLRWLPVGPLGFPHAAINEDTYKGYTIPAGATMMINVWAINHDPDRAPDPRTFDPNRYKDDHLGLYDSAVNPDASKRDNFTFGAGRRICPGMHVAERSLLLGISRLLWAFDITPVEGPGGNPIIPEQFKLTQGFAVMPEPYPAKITPRSKERANIVRKEWEMAEKELLDPVTKQWISSPL